jgi:hypothetical protein
VARRDPACMVRSEAASGGHAVDVGMKGPSLMMPCIIISFILNEQDWLDFRTVPLQG